MPRIRWTTVRRIWVRTGIAATLVFVGWMLVAMRASSEARRALVGDAAVTVSRGAHHWTFLPAAAADVGLLFYPGGLVDPVAYAPLARGVAGAGYPALLIEVPRRGAFGGADGAEPLNRAVAATVDAPRVRRWVVAGHSLGGRMAARFALTRAQAIAGLALIGTSHPRDFSLSHLGVPVVRIYGTRDTVADVDKLEATRSNLPPGAVHVRIDGGNHSQFGSYGFQPGDWPAAISREAQQRQTLEAVVELLRRVQRGE